MNDIDELPILNPHELLDREYGIVSIGRHHIHLRRLGMADNPDTGNPVDISIIVPIGEPPEFEFRGRVQ